MAGSSDKENDYIKSLNSKDFDVVMKHLMGPTRQRTPKFVETWQLIAAQKPKEERLVQAVFESCAFKSALSCVAGKRGAY